MTIRRGYRIAALATVLLLAILGYLVARIYVTFLTSAGLRVIVAARKRMAARSGNLVLANPQPQVAKVFEIIKALPGLNVFESVAELDEYLVNMQRKVTEGQS